MRYRIGSLTFCAALALALTGCGGGKSATSQATSGPMTETQREVGALPSTSVAPVPGGLHCGHQKPVWVNLKRKVYHPFGDPYYGRTHNGQYLCLADAEAKGYHAAGASHGRHQHRQSDSMSNSGADNPAPGATY